MSSTLPEYLPTEITSLTPNCPSNIVDVLNVQSELARADLETVNGWLMN